MRSAATDVPDIHTNRLPLQLPVMKPLQFAAIQLATVPKTHSLFTHVLGPRQETQSPAARDRACFHRQTGHRGTVKPHETSSEVGAEFAVRISEGRGTAIVGETVVPANVRADRGLAPRRCLTAETGRGC